MLHLVAAFRLRFTRVSHRIMLTNAKMLHSCCIRYSSSVKLNFFRTKLSLQTASSLVRPSFRSDGCETSEVSNSETRIYESESTQQIVPVGMSQRKVGHPSCNEYRKHSLAAFRLGNWLTNALPTRDVLKHSSEIPVGLSEIRVGLSEIRVGLSEIRAGLRNPSGTLGNQSRTAANEWFQLG